MKNTSTTFVPHLDGWRGIAILAVLASHFGVHLYKTWMGTFGVQLFFVLSGFLMANLLFVKQVSLSTFFKRRFSRVLPTLLVFVPAMALWFYFSTEHFPRLDEFIATLTFTRTYFPSDSNVLTSAWPVGNLWSLNVEEHSYMYLAIVALLVRFVGRPWLIISLLVVSTAIVLGFNLYYPSHPPLAAAPWYARSETASLGLFAAAAIRVFRHFSLKNSFGKVDHGVTLVCIAAAVVCHTTYQYRGLHYSAAPLLLALGINFLDRAPSILKLILSNAAIRWFGRCSFSMYLWQQPFYIAVIAYEIPNWIGLILGIAAGAASFYLIEDPARQWINSAGRRATPVVPNEPGRLRA